jgi:hypothetical protein
MKPITRMLPLLLALLPAPALAGSIDVSIKFEAPPALVVVSPGIQVVPDFDEEVFFVDGYYWTRRDDAWYRTHDYKGGWVVVEHDHVPPGLVKVPPGQYKRWHQEKKEEKHEEHHDEHHEDHGGGKGHGKH